MTKPKKVHQISWNNGSDDMKHSHHSPCSIYFKGDAFLGWMRLELQSEGLLPGGFTDCQGTTAISSPRGPQSFAKTGFRHRMSSVYGFVSGIQSDTVATSGCRSCSHRPLDRVRIRPSWKRLGLLPLGPNQESFRALMVRSCAAMFWRSLKNAQWFTTCIIE